MNLLSCTGVIPNCIPNLPVSIFFTIFDIPLHVKARLDTFPAGSITSDGTEDMAALGLVADDAFAARLADMDLVSKSLRLRFDLDGTDAEKLNCAEALLAVSDGAFSVRSHQGMAVEFPRAMRTSGATKSCSR